MNEFQLTQTLHRQKHLRLFSHFLLVLLSGTALICFGCNLDSLLAAVRVVQCQWEWNNLVGRASLTCFSKKKSSFSSPSKGAETHTKIHGSVPCVQWAAGYSTHPPKQADSAWQPSPFPASKSRRHLDLPNPLSRVRCPARCKLRCRGCCLSLNRGHVRSLGWTHYFKRESLLIVLVMFSPEQSKSDPVIVALAIEGACWAGSFALKVFHWLWSTWGFLGRDAKGAVQMQVFIFTNQGQGKGWRGFPDHALICSFIILSPSFNLYPNGTRPGVRHSNWRKHAVSFYRRASTNVAVVKYVKKHRGCLLPYICFCIAGLNVYVYRPCSPDTFTHQEFLESLRHR